MVTFDLEAAASLLNISADRLGRMAHAGHVPAAKIGRAWVFEEESLNHYLKRQVEEQTIKRSKEALVIKRGRPRNF